MGRDSSGSVSFTLKPDVNREVVAGQFATLAHDLGAAGARGASAVAQAIAQAARQLAADVFLDPAIASSLNANLLDHEQLSLAADHVATAIRQIARSIPIDAPAAGSSAAWPMEAAGGEHVLHFRLVRALREGGMGTVYLAWDERLDRHVVLKRLGVEQETLEGRRRLEREARAGARLRHINVVTIHALEYLGNEPILVQEYIEGTDLDALVGTLAAEHALRLAEAIATGLAFAHANGIIHRDLKPRNVRVRPDGTPVILDFGLGKAFLAAPDDHTEIGLTKPGVVMGTPAYMAPEQWMGEGVTPAADVFAFGVLLFELLSGRMPFDGQTRTALYAAILHGKTVPLDRADVPTAVEELIHDCLATAADARPTMADVVKRLLAIRDGVPTDGTFTNASGPEAQIFASSVERTPWFALQAATGRQTVPANGVTFEISMAFDGGLNGLSVAELERRLRQLTRDDVPIGRMDGAGLRLGAGELTVGSTHGARTTYWAARCTGELFFLAEVPLLATGTVPVDPLLHDTIHSLAYIARYAPMIDVDEDMNLFIAFELHHVGNRLVAAADWSARFTSTLTTLHRAPRPDVVSSALVASPRSLQEDLPAVLKLVFDDLLRDFPFVKVPSEYYLRCIRSALGPDAQW